MSALACAHKRGEPVLISRIHLCLSLQEQLHTLLMSQRRATLRCPHQRGFISPVLYVRIASNLASVGKQLLNRLNVATRTS
eukprot:CAMPEP_0115841640 /NCGR_PEP_ID=MMETSP0287-20121206/7392_1 /TAXON_ID=412157 /ORGANISM="Chrysochromulina rotalis, Strain UIO044" /LENGTH=80 /DNA_ID=CAMNT_0003295291 /DNA_START=262 /DNA_END=504 /DNA_ORIENTATION=+